MKRIFLFFVFVISSLLSIAQDIPNEYFFLVKTADSLYHIKEYKQSAVVYSKAFKVDAGLGLSNDRYAAACSWALANYPDSAFYHLNKLAYLFRYTNYRQVLLDPDLEKLHKDKRWNTLTETIKQNEMKSEANLNRPLIYQLDLIYSEDQKYREQLEKTESRYGTESKEMQTMWKQIHLSDSVNLIKVKTILVKYGWPGPDMVGQQGGETVFLVIQHADLITQETYLPMLKDAVSEGKLPASSLALLEDRIAIRKGKQQIYGSQIRKDSVTKQYYVLPLEDPHNVNKRRAQVNLEPIEDYLN